MLNICNLLYAVIWKNCKIRRRHLCGTVCEILFPCLIICALLFLHINTDDSKKHTTLEETNFPVITSNHMKDCLLLYSPLSLVYGPETKFTKNIMDKVEAEIGSYKYGINLVKFTSLPHKDVKNLFSNTSFQQINFGIVFDTSNPNEKEFKYQILSRFPVPDGPFPISMERGPMLTNEVYITSCLISLQKAIDEAIILVLSNDKEPNYEVNFQYFPFPAIENQEVPNTTFQFLDSFIFLGCTYFIVSLSKRIVQEKKTGIRELQRMNGLSNWMFWLGWILFANMTIIFVSLFIMGALTTSVMKAIPVISKTSFLLIFLFCFLFYNSVVFFIFVFCAFFCNSLLASCTTLMTYFISYFLIPTLLGKLTYCNMNRWCTFIACLSPSYAMRVAVSVIEGCEELAVDVSSFTCLQKEIDNISLLSIFIIFVIDMIIYGVIACYIDNLRPGPYGMAKPWHFIFQCCKKKNKIQITPAQIIPLYEQPLPNMSIGLSVKNLRKEYNRYVAVDGISIDFYNGQITALLGHNGAGKTTVMSMISGMISPTAGAVYKYESNEDFYNIFQNMERFRQQLGLCPQEDMFYPGFTVMDHLIFFGLLKGLTSRKVKQNGNNILSLLNMAHASEETADVLSKGMQRKLSLAIAIISEPQVLILDEPSSGLDPESRRALWNVLLKLRENRIIIITTHFMEEAEVLGDRIAIMDHGRISCYGTTVYLKNVYGAGYYLTLQVNKRENIQNISKKISTHIRGSEVIRVVNDQITYILPIEQSRNLPRLFSSLENLIKEHGISNIGVSCTTMEEVFIKVGEIEEMKRTRESFLGKSVTSEHNTDEGLALENTERRKGCRLILLQFWVLLLKKIKYSYRKCIIIILFGINALLMTLLTAWCCVLCFIHLKSLAEPLEVDFSMYSGTDVFIAYLKETEEYVTIYKSLISKARNIKLFESGVIVNELMKTGKEDISAYQLKNVVAADWASYKSKNVIALASTIAHHSPLVSMDLVMNTLLKHFNKDLSIKTYLYSTEMLDAKEVCGIATLILINVMWIVTLGFGLLFFLTNVILFPLEERMSKVKHLQLMTGVSPITYWAALYICDLFIYIIIICLMTIPFLAIECAYGLWIYFHLKEMSVLILMLVLFGASCIPLVYLFSYCSKSFAGASSLFILLNVVTGILKFFINTLYWLSLLNKKNYTFLTFLLGLNPFSCLIDTIIIYNNIIIHNGECTFCGNEKSEECQEDFELKPFLVFGNNDIGLNDIICLLLLDAILYFILICLIDCGIFKLISHYLCYLCLLSSISETEEKHIDVIKVEGDVKNLLKNPDRETNHLMIVDGIIKKYGTHFTAVKGVSFIVNKGECFGLLGVNGAGKTTTFKILTGEEIPTSGNAFINGYSLKKNRQKYLKQIGYCPQNDAINGVMTGREMVNIFGYLRGMRRSKNEKDSNFWIEFLGFDEYSNKYCGTYSGGNKRKLSTAMALIGNPVIIILDEPTTGVDPVNKRKLWDVLTKRKKAGQSIILTSHSMDECEALCDQLTIMVKGQMKCIGNIQYLKQIFSQGITITVKLRSVPDFESKVNSFKQNIINTFGPTCELKDEHSGLLKFHLTDTKKQWSELFTIMENFKDKLDIVESYIINETSLEEVFLSFAK